jgi:ankyrin repeat protein
MTSTPLHWAVAAGNLNEVKNLLNQGIPMNSRTVTGRTALHNAARNGHLNIVQELIKRGAIVNATTQSGKTPLQEAAGKGHPRIVHALLKAGANPKFKSNFMKNAYNYARNNATRNAIKTSRAAIKFQNFRKKSIARKRASPNTLARTVFSPARVRAMMNKYGINYLNKV